jgi:hypothetical protein
MYNKNYVFKKDGFFYKYIYKYLDYKSNINICTIDILINKHFTIFLSFKDTCDLSLKDKSLGIFSWYSFKSYQLLIQYINKKINKFCINKQLLLKEIIIYI